MVIVQTPLRISFFGGGTDYPVWYREHGGAVLATTIDKYIYIQCRELTPFHEHKHRIIYSKMEDVKEIDEIIHPAVRECFRYMQVTDGLEMHHDSDLPARSGMGSSSSFVVGLLHALHALRGEMIDRETMAKQAIHVEHNLIHENVGVQDQIMAAFGGFNHVTFDTDGEFTVKPLTLRKDRLRDLKSHMMLFYTGMQRVASTVAAEQIKNTRNRVSELTAMYQMVEEGIKILTSERAIADFGKLLNQSWMLKRQLSNKISNGEIDDMYAAAMSVGATGGKLLGAGGGGFVLLIVPPERQAAVAEKLSKYMRVSFAFENLGSNIIFFREQAA